MLLIVIIFLLLIFVGFAVGGLLGAPWVPTYKRDIGKILDDTQLKSGDTYIELGCGDGRLVAAAAKRGARAIGYEINPIMWLVSKVRNLRYSNAKIKLANFWRRPINKADVVTVFLMPKFMPRLESKARSELRPGARLASYIYKLPNKKPNLQRQRWQIYKF